MLDPQGPIGAANRLILLNALGIMLVIVVPTIIAILIFAWWFRASNTRASYRPDFVYSGRHRARRLVHSDPDHHVSRRRDLDRIPRSRSRSNRLPSPDKPLEVQVVSLDWKWLFIYPDAGIASVNELVVPAGMPVHFSLTSASVMNMFFVPQLGTMIDTMNGMVTQLHLQADQPGEFYGQSAQFSGDGFSDMNFTVRAVPPDAVRTMGRHGAPGRIRTGPDELSRALPTEQQRAARSPIARSIQACSMRS